MGAFAFHRQVTFRMLLTFTSGFGSGHPGEEFNTRAAREWRQQSQTLATGRSPLGQLRKRE